MGAGSIMKVFDTPFGKFLIVLAVFAVFECWLYASAPPQRAKAPFQALPERSSELRDCFAEGIRLDGARTVLEQAGSADIERYNRMVDAYNQSCRGRGDKHWIFEAIQSEVRANRDALWAEGIARFPAAGK
jgi:hypothetical protein